MVDFRDKYSDHYVRENPKHPDEESLADQQAAYEIRLFKERLKTPNFKKRAMKMLSHDVLDALQEDKPKEPEGGLL